MTRRLPSMTLATLVAVLAGSAWVRAQPLASGDAGEAPSEVVESEALESEVGAPVEGVAEGASGGEPEGVPSESGSSPIDGTGVAEGVEGTATGEEPGEEPDEEPDEEGEGEDEGSGGTPVDESHVVRYYLERFEVVGNESTRAETVLRVMLLEEGEAFRADDPRIEGSKAALLASGFFEDVRFSLQRGSQRGWVVFRIQVRERWTVLLENLSIGHTTQAPIYGGLGITEMNLLGTGSRLGASFVASDEQQAYRLRFIDPNFLDSAYSLQVGLLFNDARDYLGFQGVYAVRPDGTEETDHATIDYWRAGGTFGTGRSLSGTLRFDIGYRFEWIDADLPLSASYERAGLSSPVPLDLVQGRSILSVLGASLLYDSRDDPFLPAWGTRLRVSVDVASDVFGSDYSYAKFVIDHATHFLLPWGHTVKIETFAGLILGEAPLFEQFYVGDLSDLIPARVLDLNFHNYPSHNLLGTAIGEMQYEDIAARIAAEYAIPLHRGRSGFLYGCDLFVTFGFYSLASSSDVALQVPGYDGAAAFPVDITFDLGFRFDTMIGLLRLSFSNVIGMIPPVD